MTVEPRHPGVAGFGYGSANADTFNRDQDQAAIATDTTKSAVGDNSSTDEHDAPAVGPISGDLHIGGEEVTLEPRNEVPGYQSSASACLNRARQIARSLNHISLSADHLMLALTLDQGARRLLERVGDVTQLREAAMQRLGHLSSARNNDEHSSAATSDLADITKAAREAANEREQSVAISDLINAFPKLNGRLSYGTSDGSQAIALMGRIETGLVPRVTESITKIETVVLEAMQQNQTVQKMLQDLNSKQTLEAEQRQIAFMEDVRKQIREAVDAQVGAALKQFGEDLYSQARPGVAQCRHGRSATFGPLRASGSSLDPNEPLGWLGPSNATKSGVRSQSKLRQPNATWMRRPTSVIGRKADMARTCRYVR